MNPLVTLFITVIFGIGYYFWICVTGQERYLERICYGMPGDFKRGLGFWHQLRQSRGCYKYEGKCSQRALKIEYLYRWKNILDLQTDPAPDERLEIHFPLIQKFWLRMILDPGHEGQKEEITLGHPTLDSLYIIHSNQPEVAQEFLTSQAALQDLQRLPFPFDRLEIHKGWGKAEFYFPARRHFDRMHLKIAVESLARLFSDYETRSKFVIVISASHDTRCPYCRESLSESGGQVIQCIQCHARIHQSCWNENKQCTTWGCQSTTVSCIEQQS